MRALKRGLGAAALAVLLLPAVPATAEDDFVIEHFPQPHPETYFDATYGARRPGGRRHQGNDLMGEKMMPVVAVADGVVGHIAESGNAGWYLIVEHAGGWESWYLHLNDDTPGTDDGRGGMEHAVAPGIEVGARVRGGDLLGWVGDSGNAEHTAPHTHFELHSDGRPVNPHPYLVEAWRDQLQAWAMVAELL